MSSPARIKDHRRSRDRVSEESERRNHPDHLLAVRVLPARSPDLHGSPHAEVCEEVPARRKPEPRGVVQPLLQLL